MDMFVLTTQGKKNLMQVPLHHGDDQLPSFIGLRFNRTPTAVGDFISEIHISEEARYAR